MLIHLIRHTTPQIAKGICYGQTDLELANNHQEEFASVKAKLFDSYEAIYSSPLQRCLMLAREINSKELFVDDRLIEYNFGDWELKPWDSITGEHAQKWMQNYVEVAPPNGESLLMMQHRVDSFLHEILQSSYQSVAVVSHAGVLRLMHANVAGIQVKSMFDLKLDYGEVFELHKQSDSNHTKMLKII